MNRGIFGRKGQSAGGAMPPPLPAATPAPLPQDRPETPFGEDITNPDARALPLAFRGQWLSPADRHLLVLAEQSILRDARPQRVVAVRMIDPLSIAVVTLPIEGDANDWGVHYFEVSHDGATITDLESADCVYRRASGAAVA